MHFCRQYRIIKQAVFITFLFVLASTFVQASADTLSVSISVDGMKRSYTIHIPASFDKNKTYPLLVVFHGGGGNSQAVMEETQWTKKADQENFIAVFPDAYRPYPNQRASLLLNPQTWNDGSGRFYTGKNNVDDVAFVKAMLIDLSNRFNIDPERIYATGFSNGASMTFRVGLELADVFAAIAPVAGAYWQKDQELKSPVSLIYITGDSDNLNPLVGGLPRLAQGRQWTSTPKPAVQESIEKWCQMLHLDKKSSSVKEEAGYKITVWKSNDAEVKYYLIAGHGHVWPGGKSILSKRIVGQGSNKVKATEIIWQFFVQHPKL